MLGDFDIASASGNDGIYWDSLRSFLSWIGGGNIKHIRLGFPCQFRHHNNLRENQAQVHLFETSETIHFREMSESTN